MRNFKKNIGKSVKISIKLRKFSGRVFQRNFQKFSKKYFHQDTKVNLTETYSTYTNSTGKRISFTFVGFIMSISSRYHDFVPYYL